MSIKCLSCGAMITENEKFCPECGSPVNHFQNPKVFCPSCGAEVSPEEKFCPECGVPITNLKETKRICPSCKSEISDDEKFCPECGTPVSSAFPAKAGSPIPSSPTQKTEEQVHPATPNANSVGSVPTGIPPVRPAPKSNKNYLLYGIGALIIIGVAAFGLSMSKGSDKPAPATPPPAATQQQVKQVSQKDQAAAILKDLGITGPINGTTYGANPDGFYALVGKDSILVDMKNKQAARIENPEVFRKLIDARHAGREGIIYPNFLIINDKQDQDKGLGAWQAANHFIPLYVPVSFDANGNAKAERIFSGAGVTPSHFHDTLKEEKNKDLVNLFLKETFPYLDTVQVPIPAALPVDSTPVISRNSIVSAKHSSADNEDGYNHSGALTIDGDTKTCWAEGVPGLGINENITYYFNGNYKVSGLNIWIGHQKTEDLFYKNARPTVIRIIGSDGSNEVYTLQDTMGMQRVKFKHPITANNIKLVVEKVAPGTKYEDTCIAEVSFF